MDPNKNCSSAHMYIDGYSYERIAIFITTCKVIYTYVSCLVRESICVGVVLRAKIVIIQ